MTSRDGLFLAAGILIASVACGLWVYWPVFVDWLRRRRQVEPDETPGQLAPELGDVEPLPKRVPMVAYYRELRGEPPRIDWLAPDAPGRPQTTTGPYQPRHSLSAGTAETAVIPAAKPGPTKEAFDRFVDDGWSPDERTAAEARAYLCDHCDAGQHECRGCSLCEAESYVDAEGR